MSDPGRPSWVRDLWQHPWGRTLVIAITVAVVSWALRETAIITGPILSAVGQILLPLAIGFTIAYILSPLVDGLARFGLPRPLGATFLFVCFSVLLVLASSLFVPAIVRQSAELSQRSVNEFYYLDLDGNERFSPRDVRLRSVGKSSELFDDRNANGVADPGEPRYARDVQEVRLEKSLATKLGGWFQNQSAGIRRFIGVDLDEQALRELHFYQVEVNDFIIALDTAVAFAKRGASSEQWPPLLRLAEVNLEAEPQPLEWPGADDVAVRASADALKEEERSLWFAKVQEVVNRYRQRHATVIAAIERARGGPGEDDERIGRLRVALRTPLSGEEEERTRQLLELLRKGDDAGHAYAQELLTMLGAGGDGGGQFLRYLAGQLDASVSGELGGFAGMVGNWAKSLVSNIPGLLGFALDIVLIPIYAFFLVLAMPRLRRAIKDMVPQRGRERTMRILHAIERVVSAFFRGRLIVCLICGALVYLGFLIIGVPYAALFGFLIGLATAIPLAGLLFLVPALLLTVVEGGDNIALSAALAVGVYAVVQTLEATVFTPLIMGREVELHPVTLIIALLFFGKIFGILGLILAVPIAATLRILFREFVLPYVRKPVALAAEAVPLAEEAADTNKSAGA